MVGLQVSERKAAWTFHSWPPPDGNCLRDPGAELTAPSPPTEPQEIGAKCCSKASRLGWFVTQRQIADAHSYQPSHSHKRSGPSQSVTLRLPAQEGGLLTLFSHRGFRDMGLVSVKPGTHLPRMHPEVTPCSGVLTGSSRPGLLGPALPAGPASPPAPHCPLPHLCMQQGTAHTLPAP